MIRIIFATVALVFVQLVNGEHACITAKTNLNIVCINAGSDTNAICTGICQDLLDTVISSCDARTVAGYSTWINTPCSVRGTKDACTTARANLAENTICFTAIERNDADTICSETCLNLLSAIASSCDDIVSQAIQSCLRYRVITVFML